MNIEFLRKPTPERRDLLYITLAGIFLTSLVLGNVIGTTKFITLLSFELPGWLQSITPDLVRSGSEYIVSIPVGLIAYPITFLVTDLISELFGRKKAQTIVWIGFFLNLYMLLLMSLAKYFPNTYGVSGGLELFDGVYEFLIANTLSSMLAYLVAQSVDVRLFHFWKRLTKGKYLWVRNNGSTMVSQLVDSTAILSILYVSGNLGSAVNGVGALIILILNSYLFKFFFALFDTPAAYLAVWLFREYHEDPDGMPLYASQKELQRVDGTTDDAGISAAESAAEQM